MTRLRTTPKPAAVAAPHPTAVAESRRLDLLTKMRVWPREKLDSTAREYLGIDVSQLDLETALARVAATAKREDTPPKPRPKSTMDDRDASLNRAIAKWMAEMDRDDHPRNSFRELRGVF